MTERDCPTNTKLFEIVPRMFTACPQAIGLVLTERRWTAREESWLGKLHDEEIARRTGRSQQAVLLSYETTNLCCDATSVGPTCDDFARHGRRQTPWPRGIRGVCRRPCRAKSSQVGPTLVASQ